MAIKTTQIVKHTWIIPSGLFSHLCFRHNGPSKTQININKQLKNKDCIIAAHFTFIIIACNIF